MAKLPELTPAEIERYYRARVPKLRKSGAEHRAPCPIHQGTRLSLSVNFETGAAYCHSGCAKGWHPFTFEQALAGTDRKEAAAAVLELIGRPAGKPRIVAAYDYTDHTGKLLYQVCRYEPGHDGEKKTFRQRQPQGAGWKYSVKGLPLVPYRLPAVLAAELVFVVEGEKDVHTLEAWGFTATCNAMGALKWRQEYARHFAGKDVWILPDNDDPGRKHAAQVRQSLEPVAAAVHTLELPGLATGGDVTDWQYTGGTPEKLKELMELVRAEDEPDQTADIPEPELQLFTRNEHGLYWTDPEGRQHDLFLSPPLDIVAMTRDFQGENHGKLVAFTDTERHPRQAIIPHTRLIADGNDALEQLISKGFHPNRSKKAREKLKDFIWWTRPRRRVRCVDQIGWHVGRFVTPDDTIGTAGKEDVLFFSDQPTPHKLKVNGTLESWQQSIGRLAAGNSRIVFSIAAAFAATMLDPLQHECIGFHIRGLSSTGKTTALRAAGSVWGGGGPTGFLDTWRATANGLEAKAAIHNHALLCLDEISQVSEKIAGEIVYFLGNGAAKSRMTKSITARLSMTFRLVYLSTGERSLSELMRAAGQSTKAGQELRLAEIAADAGFGMGIFETLHEFPKPDQLASAITHASLIHYGAPIRAFLQKVAANLAEYAEQVRTIQEQFVRAYVAADAAGEVYRLASTFGLIAGSGELATELGITGWRPGEGRNAIRTCFVNWLENRGGAGSLDIEHGIRRVKDFIERHGASRFQEIESQTDAAMIRDRAGFKERASDGAYTWLIHEDVFRNEVCGPYDYRFVYHEMIERQLAPPPAPSDRNLTTRRRVPGLGRARFFVVLPGIFSQDGPGEHFSEDDWNPVGTVGTVGTEDLI